MTDLLPRLKSNLTLCVLLAALLAWPSTVPMVPADASPVLRSVSADSTSSASVSGRKAEARAFADWSRWTTDADDAEESDDLTCTLAILPAGPGLPDLHPTTIQGERPRWLGLDRPFDRYLPLRC